MTRMSDIDLRKLASYIVEEQAGNPQWMLGYAKAQEKLHRSKAAPRWVNSKVAAGILGISCRTMRSIKENFTYTKNGNSNQSNIYFDANKLLTDYDRLLAAKGQACSGLQNQ